MEAWAHISEKVEKDDVESAIKAAREKAVAQLGSEAIELYTYTWGTPQWVCTCWRLSMPDPPPNP